MNVRGDHTLSISINLIISHKPNLLFFVTELSHGPKRIKKNWGKCSGTYPVFVLSGEAGRAGKCLLQL